jgi:AraC-like DNA-binding protein
MISISKGKFMYKLNLKDLLNNNLHSKEDIVKNTFPQEVGKDYMEKINVQDGLLFLKTSFDFNIPTQIETKQNKKKLVICFGIEGNSNYKSLDDKDKILFNEGFTTISLFDQTEGIREFKDKKVNQMRLILDEDFLIRNFEKTILKKYYTNNKLNMIDFSPTQIETKRILKEILTHDYPRELSTVFLQSKILELLFMEIKKISTIKEIIKLDNYDKKAIFKAKEILLENMQNPPSIVNLAKQVHLNEFKLKNGFKQVFNTTPYKLLSKYKMDEAKTMLESGEYNINEVAIHLGFKYANNFSNAFFKEFKILPKEVRKKYSLF